LLLQVGCQATARLKARTATGVHTMMAVAHNTRGRPGIVRAGTNTEHSAGEAERKTTMYTAAWTASAVRTSSPTTAITHDQAYPNANATPMPPSTPKKVVW